MENIIQWLIIALIAAGTFVMMISAAKEFDRKEQRKQTTRDARKRREQNERKR